MKPKQLRMHRQKGRRMRLPINTVLPTVQKVFQQLQRGVCSFSTSCGRERQVSGGAARNSWAGNEHHGVA